MMVTDVPAFLKPDSLDPRALADMAAHCGIATLDAGGRFTGCSDTFSGITGWTPERVLGRAASLLYADEGEFRADLEAAQDAGHHETRAERLRPDGSRFHATAVLMALRQGGGRPTGYVLLVCDRADIDAAADVLRVREGHLSAVVEAFPSAVVTIDEQGLIRAFSRRAERQFGYAAEEVIGRNVSMLMPAPYRDAHDGYIARYLATGEKRVMGVGRVVTGERKDGTTFPMELNIAETRTGAERYFTGFVRDLTERQKTEARMQDLQSELIHVTRLTALGEMASGLAHELNQPLGAISNYLKGCRRLLERGEDADTDTLLQALDRAAEQAVRAGQIISRLRGFVAHRESECRIERVSKLVEEAGALALVGAKDQDIQVRFDLDPAATSVLADRIQIQQVLLNLMRNAIEAMEGCERRELTVSTRARADAHVEFRVSDTGPGLSEYVASNLFQPFVTSKPHGMGVGLSICRTIVEAHGGHIWVEPREGGGTVFAFTLGAFDAERRDE